MDNNTIKISVAKDTTKKKQGKFKRVQKNELSKNALSI